MSLENPSHHVTRLWPVATGSDHGCGITQCAVYRIAGMATNRKWYAQSASAAPLAQSQNDAFVGTKIAMAGERPARTIQVGGEQHFPIYAP